jgi:protoporphyrinogen oxidase
VNPSHAPVARPPADARDSAANRTAIVGGGVLGMTLALRLAARGDRVTLFEAAESSEDSLLRWDVGGVVWDRHYHVTLFSDRNLRALLRELDLEAGMRGPRPARGSIPAGAFTR